METMTTFFLQSDNNNSQMSSKQFNYESQYKSVKAQYDALLDKNQNDLIKIKQREKQLTDELDRTHRHHEETQRKHQEQMHLLHQELETLKKNHTQGQLVVSVETKERERMEQLEVDARRLIDQNIEITAENTSLNADLNELTRTNQELTLQNERLKTFIESLQKQLTEFKATSAGRPTTNTAVQTQKRIFNQEDMNTLKQQLSHLQKQLQNITTANSDLKHRLKASEEDFRMLSDRQRKSVHLLKKKDLQLSQVHDEVQKLRVSGKHKKRKTESEQSVCVRCRQFEQEIQLLKQMVKSTKGMVRVREIEVEKYRMHSHEQMNVKDNKSYGKAGEKGPTLPPLRKNLPS